MKSFGSWLVLLLCGSACATLSNPSEEGRSRPEDLATFVRYLEEDLEAHAWQALLSTSDPELYRTRVVEGGIEEIEYLTELLGLRSEGNDIQEGDELDWEDLDRIESAALSPPDDEGSPARVSGSVTLATGETLQIEANVREVQGRLVLAEADP